MLASYSRKTDLNDQNDSDVNLDSESIRLQRNSTLVGEDFRSLLITNSREKSQMNMETLTMTSDETTNQVTMKLNGIKISLNSQIQEAIRTAIAEKLLPSI